MKIKYSIFLLLVLLAIGCQKDEIGVTETTIIGPQTIETIQTSVSGLVTDQDGNPLAGVSVQYKADFLETDVNGYFKVKEATAAFDGGLLKFNQDGFFKNYKWFYPQLEDNAFVRVVMVEEKLVGSLSSSEGGTVTLNGGATVEFPAGAIDAQGDVKIYGHWYNPIGNKLAEEMPGDLRGIDSEQALVQLATYGMVAVEIRDANNNDIQLKDGTTATITFPLPDELQEFASETIKTWSFDEDRAYWLEEGTAALSEGNYVAEVSHFSFWNCDAPFPVVHIKGRLVDSNGNGLTGVKMCITDLSRSITRMGWTSYGGVFCGKIPKNAPLKIVAKDECDENIIYQGEIGPFSEDIDLGDLVVDNTSSLNVTGRLLCNGVPVTNGYALIALTNGAQFVAETDDDGNFTISLPQCELNKFSIKGYSTDSDSASEWEIYEDITDAVSVGNIEVCDGAVILDEFIKYKMDGSIEFVLETPEARLINGQLRILDNDNQENGVNLFLDAPQQGINNVKRLQAYLSSANLGGSCGSTNPGDPGCINMICELITYDGLLGNYIEGEFMGTLPNSNGQDIDIMGSFRVRLDEVISESIISGYVWDDTNENGVRDVADGDSPPSFSRVLLYKDDILVQSVTTRAGDGFYSFSVEPGNYYINFTKPGGYRYVDQGQGTDPSIDSDADPDTGNTEEFVVDGTSSYAYDAGLFFVGGVQCIEVRTSNASCGAANGSYRLIVDSQDSLFWEDYVLETYQGMTLVSSTEFEPWVPVTNLASADYTATLMYNGTEICSVDFTIEEGLECEFWPFVECDGNEYFGYTEYSCNTQVTVLWETGETGTAVSIPGPGIYNATVTDEFGCEEIFAVDFTDVPLPQIQGTVWVDSIIGNPNLYDAGFERTLANVEISLYQNGNLVDMTLTNANGIYSFTPAGGSDYTVGVSVPSGFALVEKFGQDPNQLSDSDIEPTTGLSDPFALEECGGYKGIMIGLNPE